MANLKDAKDGDNVKVGDKEYWLDDDGNLHVAEVQVVGRDKAVSYPHLVQLRVKVQKQLASIDALIAEYEKLTP